MSDYVHNKSIMYPITEEDILKLCKKFNIEDIWDIKFTPAYKQLEVDIQELGINKEWISICSMCNSSDSNIYFEITLYHTYGDESGEFGKSRFLSETEQKKYLPYIQRLLPEADPAKLKYVDYCWYNCCEPDDYYLNGDFNREL